MARHCKNILKVSGFSRLRLALAMIYVCWLGVVFLKGTDSVAQNTITKLSRLTEQDSLLLGFSLDELEQYKNLYSREMTRLQSENIELRRRGIRDGELFLATHPQSQLADKVMMRLAELYYDQAQDDFQAAMHLFDSLMVSYSHHELPTPPIEPKKELQRPIQLYFDIMRLYPASSLADDATYNLALLLEETGKADSAIVYYEKILRDYPETPLIPDVLMRIGEYYFNPPHNHYERAVSYFTQILQYRDSPRYDEALYRLGWCSYRRNEFAQAISYFTVLVDDITHTLHYDPLQKHSNPSLLEEAVEYIGLCFLEYGGVDKAAQYIQDIGGRSYGVNILKRMGDAYMEEKEDYPLALRTYQIMLNMYPYDPIAPLIQNCIVQAYQRMDDPAMAYFARDFLFQQYRPGSDWWAKNEGKKTRAQALMFVENALRDNIALLINRAQENGQKEFYRQAVVESRKYLEHFPHDSLTAMIHWNMALILDTKLQQKTEAFAEYLKISQSYMDSNYQRKAAENAIVIAHEIVEGKQSQKLTHDGSIHIEDLRNQFGTKAEKILKFRERMRIHPTPLSSEEQQLAEAYINYITLFPHEADTPIYLKNVGILFYQHCQFQEALKYFNTLLKHFSHCEEAAKVQFAVMESYFGKADFPSAEIVARRILYSVAPEDLKTKARRRLAEAIFLNAEFLAEEQKHLEAGNEYRRMAREDPQGPFLDLALFNAALEYEKAGEFNRAIEAYNYLVAYFPESSFVYDAQNNLAFDYAEVKDYRNAALTYERVAAIHPEAKRARDALYNAGLFYSQIGDLQNTIRINKDFAEKYPQDELADDLAFELANLYQQLNEGEKAQQAYQEFIRAYPSSPRVIEAYYGRAKYLLALGQTDEAIEQLEAAISFSHKLDAKSLEESAYFLAEAEFTLAMIYFEEFETIHFQLPRSDLEKSKLRKKELFQKIIHHLGNCAGRGTARVYEATYMIGRTYQVFAQTWEEQQLPPMEPNRKLMVQKEIYEASGILFNRAANTFYQGIQVLRKLNEANRGSTAPLPDSVHYSINAERTTSSDSLRRLADKWIEQCKMGLTAVLYRLANGYYQSALLLLNAPIPSRLVGWEELNYRRQILEIGVEPLFRSSIDQLHKNIQLADSLKFVSEWSQLSRQKLTEMLILLHQQHAKLAMDGLSFLQDKIDSYSSLLYRTIRSDTKLEQMKECAHEMANSSELCKSMIKAISLFSEKIIRWNNAETLRIDLADYMTVLMQSFASFCDKSDTVAASAEKYAHQAREYFARTGVPLYEQAATTLEKTATTILNYERELIDTFFNYSALKQRDAVWQRMALLQLAKFDPDQFASMAEQEIQQDTIATDSTWKTHSCLFDGWTTLQYDDQLWLPPSRISVDQEGYPTIWNAAQQKEMSRDKADNRSMKAEVIYFRKTFNVDGFPIACRINFHHWPEMDVYMNGFLIKKYSQQTAHTREEIDLSPLLVSGKNVIAIEAKVPSSTPKILTAQLVYRWLPGWYEKMAQLKGCFAKK